VKNFLTVLTAIALFGLIACEGPAGPAGKDGADGTQGPAGQNAGFVYFDGFKADLKCATCHTSDLDTAYFVAGRKANLLIQSMPSVEMSIAMQPPVHDVTQQKDYKIMLQGNLLLISFIRVHPVASHAINRTVTVISHYE
jgi:hypothetical protein